MKRTGAVVIILLGLAVWWYVRDRQHGGGGDDGRGVTQIAGGGSGARGAAVVADPRMRAPAAIRGTVRGEGGKALAGATVCALAQDDALVSEDVREPRCVATDAAGLYAFTSLVPVRYALTASAPAHRPRSWRDPVTGQADVVRVGPGEVRTGVDFTLRGGGVQVSGVVEDVSGGPIAGALVLVPPEGRWGAGAGGVRTDAEGRFTVWARPGSIRLQARAEGYAGGESETVSPTAGARIYMTPESALAGTVVRPDGTPVAGAIVGVRGGMEETWATARSDDAGHFRMSRLAPGRYKPTASGDGVYGEAAESVLLGLGQTVDGVVVTVGPASSVRGKVVIDRAGATAPCPRGSVTIRDHNADNADTDTLDADGAFAMTSVLPGRYKVEVRCRDHAAKDSYPPVEVVAGRDVDGLVWTVTPGGVLAGVVKTAAGAPVPDAMVSVRAGGGARGMLAGAVGRTGDDGRYRLAGVPAGEYAVWVNASSQRAPMPPPKVTVAEGAEAALDVTMLESGAVRGTVVDPAGQPIANAQIQSSGAMWSFGDATRSADDGSFLLEGVEPGTHRVFATRGLGDLFGRRDEDRGEPVTIVAGQTATVRLVIEAQDLQIAGVVVDSGGAPIGDAWVVASLESARPGLAAGQSLRMSRWMWSRDDRPVVTATDGRFVVPRLQQGAYTVRAYRRGGGEAVAEHVEAGTDVTLEIPRTGSIAGAVTVAGGGAPDGFGLTLSDEKTGFTREERFFATGGKFVLRDLPAGTFVVAVEAGAGRAQTTVALAAGEDKTGVAIALEARLTVTGRFVDLDSGAPVPGIRASVGPVRGRGAGLPNLRRDGEGAEVSGADGRFTVTDAPAGPAIVVGMGVDRAGPYGFSRAVVELAGGPTVDVGDVPLVRDRVGTGEKPGDFGWTFAQGAPDADPRTATMTVATVVAGGAAARGGVVAGDVIVSVDGHDTRGGRTFLGWSLLSVPPGRKVELGLARGARVELTAGAPKP